LPRTLASRQCLADARSQWRVICGAPDQSDCNIEYTAAVTEALLQSHAGEISLLAALPVGGIDGSITGLRTRGGLEVDR
jgi:hypothetical protein